MNTHFNRLFDHGIHCRKFRNRKAQMNMWFFKIRNNSGFQNFTKCIFFIGFDDFNKVGFVLVAKNFKLRTSFLATNRKNMMKDIALDMDQITFYHFLWKPIATQTNSPAAPLGQVLLSSLTGSVSDTISRGLATNNRPIHPFQFDE